MNIRLHRWNPFNWNRLVSFLAPTFYGGGGGGPQQSTSTVTQSSIPDWLKPQTEAMLGEATKQIFQTTPGDNGSLDITGVKGYTPYSTNPQDYVANYSHLQQQAFDQAGALRTPGQFNQASNYANAAGQGGLQSAQQALGYGNAGFQSGQLGQQLGIQGGQRYGAMGAGYGQRAADIGEMALQAQDYGMDVGNQARNYAAQSAGAGLQYLNAISDLNAVQQFMSPYQQAVTDVAKQGALRDFQVGQTYRQSNAAKSGAYGGARQAIENAEAQRNLNTQLQSLQVQGQQNAYNQAIQNMGQGTQYGLSGLQGAQTGLNTALSGGQLGLSGIGQAIAGQQAGISGAGMGLQGVDRQLAGTAQGMQGAQVGLQGVQGAQAGYGLANTAGQNLANIGSQQLAADTSIIGTKSALGNQLQQRAQDVINANINNYSNAQTYPMQQLAMYNALLRGYAVPTSAQTTYQSAPSAMSQFGGLAATGLGAYMASKKDGGVIDEPKKYASGGLVDLAIANAMGEA